MSKGKLRDAQGSLDTVHYLVRDYEKAGHTHNRELETAKRRVFDLEKIRKTQAREIEHSQGIVAEKDKSITVLKVLVADLRRSGNAETVKLDTAKEELNTVKEELNTVKEELNTVKEELNAAKEELQKLEQLKEFLNKTFGIDNASDMG
jgi:chromosome segregation ATPase